MSCDSFGNGNPRKMPKYFFSRAIRLYYATAVKADIKKQNFSVLPRYWYVDALVMCADCGNEFYFSADEQKIWYEQYRLSVDAFPIRCIACRHRRKEISSLRQEYDRTITPTLRGNDLAAKKRLIIVIDRLCELGSKLQARVLENRKTLAIQIAGHN